MKIYLFTSKLNFKTSGGSVTDFHLKAKGLKEAGYKVTAVTVYSQSNFIDFPLPYDLKEEITLTKNYFGIQKSFFSFLKKYENQADVFYVEGHSYIFSAIFYKLLGGKVPIIAFFNFKLNSIEDNLSLSKSSNLFKYFKSKFKYYLEYLFGRLFANKIDKYIFNTPMLEKIYLNRGYPKEKSCVVEDFVDTESIVRKNLTAEPDPLDDNKEIIKIFCSGRMVKEKGFDLVIRAFKNLEMKDRLKLTIGGDGPEKKYLENLAREQGDEAYINFPGWVSKEELYNSFQRSDIFIFPKWNIEYGSVVLTEAMAFGLASVIPGGGALEWLSGGAALTFKNDDYNDLAEKLKILINDRHLRESLKQKSVARAKELDCKLLTKKFIKVIEALKLKLLSD